MDASDRLIKAAKSDNIKEVKKLLGRGALFTKDEFGNTALHEAAWSGNSEVVKILLKAYCFVDSVNGAGFTPLHLASQNGHAKVAKILLKWKGSPSLKNQHDENPIHLVAKYDHAHLIPVFAAAKADLNLKAKDENTPLHIAAKLGNTATVKVLIQNGANPNITNQKSKQPIDYAEICKYPETVKILFPITERSLAGGCVNGDIPKQTRSPLMADLELSKEAKGRRSFFKSRSSSKSPKDTTKLKSSLKQDTPVFQYNDTVQMRPRSNTVTGVVNSKRYSREFEDVSPLLYSTSTSSTSTTSIYSRSNRSKTRSPSLEELLEEVEKETQGPNYRYVPPSLSDSDNDTGSVSCHPLNRLSNGSLSPNNSNSSYNFYRTPRLSSSSQIRHTPSPLLKSPQHTKDTTLYDMLSPEGFLKPRTSKTSISECENKDDDYVCLRPSSEINRRTSTENGRQNTYSVPLIPDEVLSHTYEYLPPLPQEKWKKEEKEGFESYIEMGPIIDMKQNLSPKIPKSPLKFSPAKKVAVICDDQIEASIHTKCEPVYDNEGPAKSILAQFEGEKRNSEIDKYLQDELDTIRQAFQIRLTQMDKRYKRHLASVSSVQKTSSSSVVKTGPVPGNDTFTRHHRRASWHGKMKPENDSPPSGPAYPMGAGFETGSEESLSSSIADSSCYDGFNETTEIEEGQLDQINDVQDNDHVNDFTTTTTKEHDSALPNEMRVIIQERVQQYKSQMMEIWMKEAEDKIVAMEQEYMKKMNTQKLYHLPISTEKGPETFV